MVPFIGRGGIESTVCVTDIGADGIAKRAVLTERRKEPAAGRIVAAGAIGFAGRDIVADPGTVLPWRVQQVPLKAAHGGRFVPDRVRNPRAEFDAIVAAAIAHHDLVIAPHP